MVTTYLEHHPDTEAWPFLYMPSAHISYKKLNDAKVYF